MWPNISSQLPMMFHTLPISMMLMATTVSLMLSVNCLKALLTQMKGRDRIWMIR